MIDNLRCQEDDMADKRPAHRRGTTGDAWRKLQRRVFKGTVCERCGGTKFVMNYRCAHPSHAKLRYCPTHPLAKSVGHIIDLADGGDALDPKNVRLEHLGCNSSAGSKARHRVANRRRSSWSW